MDSPAPLPLSQALLTCAVRLLSQPLPGSEGIMQAWRRWLDCSPEVLSPPFPMGSAPGKQRGLPPSNESWWSQTSRSLIPKRSKECFLNSRACSLFTPMQGTHAWLAPEGRAHGIPGSASHCCVSRAWHRLAQRPSFVVNRALNGGAGDRSLRKSLPWKQFSLWPSLLWPSPCTWWRTVCRFLF